MKIKIGFSSTICGSYFLILVGLFRKHILAENTFFTNHTEWLKHWILVFITSYFQNHFYQWLRASSIFLLSKCFVKQDFNFNFQITNTRQDNEPLKHLFVAWFIMVPEKHFVKLYTTKIFHFSWNIKLSFSEITIICKTK